MTNQELEMDYPTFAGHYIILETDRLILRPFEINDFETALTFYQDPEFKYCIEGNRDTVIDLNYLQRAGEYMSKGGSICDSFKRNK